MLTTRIIDNNRRFWSKVNTTGECWQWTAYTYPNGYGKFSTNLGGAKWGTEYAHRYAYELLVGPIPDGLQIDHLCRNRACVNPAHMEVVTPRVNTLRSNSPAAIAARRPHCKNGHPWTEENTWREKNGARHCRTCNRENQAKQREARKRRVA